MHIKPFYILSFLIIVLLATFGLAYIYPSNGISISDKITLNFHLNTNADTNNEIRYANISHIIEDAEITIDTITADTTLTITKIDTIRVNSSELKKKGQPIEYPSGDSSALYPLFKKLDNCEKNRTRIMHYGDSQIEGDRITGYLRNKFQKRFGGSGIGLMPIIPPRAESSSIIHNASGNWQKHAVYLKKDTILPHKKFGVLGSFARFTSYHDDTSNVNKTPVSAWVSFSKSGMAFRSVRNFYTCRVFYGNCSDSCFVKGYINDSLVWFEELEETDKTKMFQWNFRSPPTKFKIEVDGKKSPDFYCVSLDAHNGVAVDNLPFRGSSGLEFTKLDYSNMAELLQYFNTGLVIMEFGVNVVPYPSSNYDFYERSMTYQIKYLKKLMPNASFLIIGVSDMSKKSGNYYTTHPNVKKVLAAQKQVAKNTECAFWNMYEAMGGENSMPSWVFAKPSLAQKDFIHFNRQGGHIISQMLYDAIIKEYEYYSIKDSTNIK